MHSLLVPAVLVLGPLAGPAPSPHFPVIPTPTQAAGQTPQEAFRTLANEFLAFHFYFNPVEATELGVHDHDGRLPDLSQDGIFSRVAAYHGWLERLEALDREALTGDAHWDHRILEYAIRARILEMERIRPWERHPLYYTDLVARALAPLASSADADPAARIRSLMGRQRQLPELLGRARENLLNPAPVHTELALERTRGLVNWMREAVPAAFRDAPPELRAELDGSNRRAVEELRRFASWLEEDLLPRSRGEFRRGGELLESELRYREHLDLSPADLLDLSGREIQRYRDRIEAAAADLDATRPTEEVVRSLGTDPPPGDSLLVVARGQMLEARDFLVSRDLLTLPTDGLPVVRAMSPHQGRTIASLRTPGLFERGAGKAEYMIKLPEPGWSPEELRGHLSLLARPRLLGITIHQTFPGHHVQLAHLRNVSSGIRKAFLPATVVAGWAHYTEEMMLDQGFGGGDPAHRVAQVQAALLRLVRLRTGLLMHTRGAGVEEAAGLFEEMAYLDPLTARQEALRGTLDPLYGAQALGKMQILALRGDYREYLSREGETYVLANFHDRFLRLGVPLSMARRILIPGDTRPSLR